MLINHGTEQLYNQLNHSLQLLERPISREERIALANYIGNVYAALNLMNEEKIEPDLKHVFGNSKNRHNFLRRIDIYEVQMLDHFILNKDFHRNFMLDSLTIVEDEMRLIPEGDFAEKTILSEDEFYDIFLGFMKSIHLEELFLKFVQENRIYSVNYQPNDKMKGFTIFNPITKETDSFVGDFNFDISSMLTLAHEFGHAYDLSLFHQDVPVYNQYFYQSFFNEAIPKMFELLFIQYLVQNHIMMEEAKDLKFETSVIHQDFMLSAYMLSLLPDSLIKHSSYKSLSIEEFVRNVKPYFLNDDGLIEGFVRDSPPFDLLEIFKYSYGSILALFLKKSVLEFGYSDGLFGDFLQNRAQMFSEQFFRDWEIDSTHFEKLYKKEMEILKK